MTDRNMSSEMLAEVNADENHPFNLISVALDSGTVYLTDSFKTITYGGNDYLATGHFLGFDSIPESAMIEVATVTGTLSGVDKTYISALLSEDYIDRSVEVYKGFYNSSMQPVVNPLLVFGGTINGATINEDPEGGTCEIELSVSSIFSNFERLNGRHTTDAEQQFHFSGDKGFEFCSEVDGKDLHWGKL